MPTDYKIAMQGRILHTLGFGKVTFAEILELRQRYFADPKFSPDVKQVIDLSEVTELLVTSQGMRELAKADPITGQRGVCHGETPRNPRRLQGAAVTE